MKNLEKFNAETTPLGTELITRDGREVSEWYYFKTSIDEYSVMAVLDGIINSYSKDGKYDSRNGEHTKDLFIKPKVKECWVNVYSHPTEGVFLGVEWSTKEEAKEDNVGVHYIKTIRITDEPETN